MCIRVCFIPCRVRHYHLVISHANALAYVAMPSCFTHASVCIFVRWPWCAVSIYSHHHQAGTDTPANVLWDHQRQDRRDQIRGIPRICRSRVFLTSEYSVQQAFADEGSGKKQELHLYSLDSCGMEATREGRKTLSMGRSAMLSMKPSLSRS